jgi:hypothetical protein
MQSGFLGSGQELYLTIATAAIGIPIAVANHHDYQYHWNTTFKIEAYRATLKM